MQNLRNYTPVDERGERVEFTDEVREELKKIYPIACRRIKRLFGEMPFTPIAELLNKAYIQGMTDAALSL